HFIIVKIKDMKKNGSIKARCLTVPVKLLLMIKLVIILLLTTTFQAFALNGFTQHRINLKIENQSISAILKAIESKYDYTFFYNDELGLNNIHMDLKAKNATIDNVMEHLLKDTYLQYEKVSKGIVVIISDIAIAAPIPIKGQVVDEKGNPLQGVSIIEKGTANGTSTNEDGSFSLNVKNQDAILLISNIGYAKQELSVKNDNYTTIILKAVEAKLDEVVVIGYGTMRKRDLTGAITQLRPDKIADENPRTVQDILRGTPGLTIGLDASAKNGGSINIRGQRSVYTAAGHNSPLLILDGMIFYGELSEINPDDIEQIDILKDASAAAVYGAQSAN